MSADPEPSDLVVLHYIDGSVGERASNRVDGLALVDFLELKAGVLRVVSKPAVGFASEFSRVCVVTGQSKRQEFANQAVSGLASDGRGGALFIVGGTPCTGTIDGGLSKLDGAQPL